MSLLQKMSSALYVALLTLVLFSGTSLAAGHTSSTLIISIQDESSQAFSGEWYLHQGTSVNGSVVRNGSSGETFQMDTGSYFLEVRNLLGSHPYHLLYSDNPQFVEENETITFNVQYFKTEEAMLIASGNPPEPQDLEPESQQTDVIDGYGCNVTQGYAWCAADDVCTKFWSPACLPIESEGEEDLPEESEPSTEPVTSVATSPASYIQVPTFNTPPSDVPTFETPPAEFGAEIGAVMPIQLAQTGSSSGLMLTFSMLLGWGYLRKKADTDS